MTLEEISVIFDGKHVVQNDLLDKQNGVESPEMIEGKDGGIERREAVEI